MTGKDIWKELESLPEEVRYFIVSHPAISTSLMCTSECESPIEQILSIALHREAFNLEMENKDSTTCRVERQCKINKDEATYRVDFLVVTSVDGRSVAVAVECDGHDFHEKTKEQAARDKARDRAIQSKGIAVLRFTGSEIYKDPFACAGEVIKTIKSLAGLSDK